MARKKKDPTPELPELDANRHHDTRKNMHEHAWGQTEFQVNLKLGLTLPARTLPARTLWYLGNVDGPQCQLAAAMPPCRSV